MKFLPLLVNTSLKIYYTIIHVWKMRITLAIGTSMNAYKRVIDEAVYVQEVSDY